MTKRFLKKAVKLNYLHGSIIRLPSLAFENYMRDPKLQHHFIKCWSTQPEMNSQPNTNIFNEN